MNVRVLLLVYFLTLVLAVSREVSGMESSAAGQNIYAERINAIEELNKMGIKPDMVLSGWEGHNGIAHDNKMVAPNDMNQWTYQRALLDAAVSGKKKVLELTLAAGANINGQKVEGFAFRPLYLAVLFEDPRAVRMLLDYGAEIEQEDLSTASKGNNKTVIEILRAAQRKNLPNKSLNPTNPAQGGR